MLQIILGALGGVKARLYAILAVLGPALLIGAYWLGRRDSAAARRLHEAEKTVETLRKARRIEDEIQRLDDAALRQRAARWVRDAG